MKKERIVKVTLGVVTVLFVLSAQQPTCNRCSASYIPVNELKAYTQRAIANNLVDQQVRLVQESGAIPAAFEEAAALVSRARSALQVLPAGIERDALDALAGYVTHRAQ